MHRQRWQRLARMISGQDNTLHRGVDRVEAAIVIGLVVSFFVGAPLLAIFAARTAGAVASRERRAERGWTEVSAVLEQGGAAGTIGLTGSGDASWVRARWTMPRGGTHTGLVAVAVNARAGDQLAVWVTSAGKLTHQPLSQAQASQWRTLAATLTPLSLAIVLLAAGGITRTLANRRRMAGWTQAWEAIGPRWSSHR